ncbi:HAD-IIB family hydrolase [Tropicimonas isoalkanivorans]|uniref:sucrose-phosphate synthase n=1 Tax=Tropicimonas isoalkanivorans TaxID=441112 RepID=A0A1I1HAS2_9RHOB|nr:HAD-IIB family hydrolase [Tropicimonas isoalkanivorans]SFC21249.1 sucrose-phosphate synthase [Tropicimonas isoalkanivorans]
MHVVHIALGGCLRSPPVNYGLTEDTGGHIAYVLGAAMAQARRPDIRHVDIVTRAFDAQHLGACHALVEERVGSNCTIRRLRSGRSEYLCKDALEAEIPALTEAFLRMIGSMPRRPDILHAHFADAAVLAEAASRAFGIPWVYSSHSLALDKGGPRAFDETLSPRIAREYRAVRAAGAIIASSRDEAERQITAYDADAEGRTHRISPGVSIYPHADESAGRVLLAPYLRDPSKPIILAIARPIAKKNLAALVKAFADAPDLRQRTNLVIVAGLRDGLRGGDAERDSIIADLFDAIDRNDLWGSVALPRQHGPEHISSLYAIAARDGVFVNAAHHEPFGLTLIEAAQAGVPVVATRNGGPVDIVRSLGYGELVDPAAPEDIARGIRSVLNDSLRDARTATARRRACEIYDWDNWADRVQNVYSGLNAPSTSRPPVLARALLASDIDGTLTGDEGSARRFTAWHRGRSPGQVFAVATGRSIVEAQRVLENWSLPQPDVFITSVGTEIWRRTQGGSLQLCKDYARRIGADWNPHELRKILATLQLDPQPRYDQRRWKLSFFGSSSDAERIEAALAASAAPAKVVFSHGRLIDVLPSRSGKAAAIRFEARRLRLTDTDCVVAGDSGNDLDMLQAFACAIIPANASEEVASATRAYRSPLPYADGVLDGLVHFGLRSSLTVAAE